MMVVGCWLCLAGTIAIHGYASLTLAEAIEWQAGEALKIALLEETALRFLVLHE